jgi:DNA-binding NarL/FixJ family response regulator
MMTDPVTKVLLIDGYTLVRRGLELMLSHGKGIDLIGSTGSVAAAIKIIQTDEPDVVLFDPDYEDGDGFALLLQLRRITRKTRIIILTGISDREAHKQFVSLGADGLVQKDQSSEVLWQAIEKVVAGELWFDRTLVWEVIGGLKEAQAKEEVVTPESKIKKLTQIEAKIINLVSSGHTHKQIAKLIGVSERTVRYNLASLLDKLELKNRTELIAFAANYKIPRTD